MGPAASQIAIKQLGTNGGGFFNVNSAHPFENPTALSNFLEHARDAPASRPALCYTFGRMVGDTRQGWAVLGAMMAIFVPLAVACIASEQAGNPPSPRLGVDQAASALQAGGNMEGQGGALRHRELRHLGDRHHRGLERLGQRDARLLHAAGRRSCPLCTYSSARWSSAGSAAASTACSCSSIIAVFVAGLMVGRTPEYLGKKIEAFEMKMASLVVLLPRDRGPPRHRASP